MARTDLIALFAQSANRGCLRNTVEALTLEERSQQHHVLAGWLQESVCTNGKRTGRAVHPLEAPIPQRFLDATPGRTPNHLVLTPVADLGLPRFGESDRAGARRGAAPLRGASSERQPRSSLSTPVREPTWDRPHEPCRVAPARPLRGESWTKGPRWVPSCDPSSVPGLGRGIASPASNGTEGGFRHRPILALDPPSSSTVPQNSPLRRCQAFLEPRRHLNCEESGRDQLPIWFNHRSVPTST